MKVWITKYALSQGVYEAEVETFDDAPHMVCTVAEWPQYFHGDGKDWHRTKESALARCEVMRKAKLASIEKARKRIAALDFAGMLD